MFFFNGRVSNIFYFTEHVKFMHFKLFETVYRNAESDQMKKVSSDNWHKLCNDDVSLYRYVPNIFYFTKNVKFLHNKLFGTVCNNSELVSNEISFLRQLTQAT